MWGLDLDGPVRELLDIAEERLEIPVLIERFGDEKVAGVLLRHGGGENFVALNADHGAVRQRFTLAHELGHVHMQHQPRVELSADLFGGRSRDPQEAEANYFAAELLAPRPAVTGWLEERDLFGRRIQPDVVVQLALEFGISFPTAAYRLERSGAIDAIVKTHLVNELSQVGGSLVRLHAAHRLMDMIEARWRGSEYPRIPRRTASYAARAHAAGLLDEDEYASIVAEQPELDFADWMA
jgi:Zn-dependent peptidase ImmA (M78 family)